MGRLHLARVALSCDRQDDVVGEGAVVRIDVHRCSARGILVDGGRNGIRAVSEVPADLQIPQTHGPGEGAGELHLLALFHGLVLSGEHLQDGRPGNRSDQRVLTLGSRALPRRADLM